MTAPLRERLHGVRYRLMDASEIHDASTVNEALAHPERLLPPASDADTAALCERVEVVASNIEGRIETLWHQGDHAADCRALIATVRRLEAEREAAREALGRAANQFDHYAVLHHAKGPDGLGKARANENMAQMCRRALAPAPTQEPG